MWNDPKDEARPDDFLELENLREDEIIAEIYLHVLFWTRKLKPDVPREMLAGATEVMDQAMFKVEGEALAAGDRPNHLHILARISPNHSVQEVLDTLRQESQAAISRWSGRKFLWHESELAVTISPSRVAVAKESIQTQASHHEIVSFESELKAIFDEHGFEWDEKEIWG